MTTVMCFGSFDVLHPGHLYYLREAKKYGKKLIVVIAKDVNFKKFKNKEPKYNEKQRLEYIRDIPYVDKAVLGSEKDILDVIEEFNPDIICLGYDQKTINETELKEGLSKRGIKSDIMRIGSYREDIYKSSKLK
ncbi:FAD synthase [Candidatus Woesearchaeota archaeon]|nr:FAD synthase [Candidatus Woesearchaeota archaeon]